VSGKGGSDTATHLGFDGSIGDRHGTAVALVVDGKRNAEMLERDATRDVGQLHGEAECGGQYNRARHQ